MLERSVLLRELTGLNFKPEIILFVSRVNTQLRQYVSCRPDPGAIATDTVTLNWCELKFYAFQCNSNDLSKDPIRLRWGSLCAAGLADPKLVCKSVSIDVGGYSSSQSLCKSVMSPQSSRGGTSSVEENESVSMPLLRESLERYGGSSSASDILLAS